MTSTRHPSSMKLLQRAMTACLFLSACTLDVGPGRSNCIVDGQSPLGSVYGLSVFVSLPQTCPFGVAIESTPVAFSATVYASEAYIPNNSYLYHLVRNRLDLPIHSNVTLWVTGTNGRVVSPIIDQYLAATGGYTASSNSGIGQDTWYLSTTQIDSAFTGPVESGAAVRLTYYKEMYAAMDINVIVPNPFEQVQLTAHAPSWMNGPHRYVWYRNGEFLGEFGETVQVMAGGPNETVSFGVVVTASDGAQVRGGRDFTSRDHACEPYEITC